MKLNFKYYNTANLSIFILVFAVIYIICKNIITQKLQLKLNENIASEVDVLMDTLGWLSPIFILYLILLFINEIGWKYKMFKWLVDLPDLNGRYAGELVSSFIDEKGKPIVKDCILEIKQNASSICVNSYYADKGSNLQTSMAFSISNEIVKEPNGNFSLYYIFTNEPNSMIEALNKHSGTAKFVYFKDIKKLEGYYYNHRLNKGTIQVNFIQKKKIHRFSE